MVEDGSLEADEVGPGVETELGGTTSPVAKHLERVRLASGSIERQHQLAAESLAPRVGGDERLELRDEAPMTPELEQSLDPVLLGLEPPLGEPLDLRLGEVVEGEVGEGGAAPECECRIEARQRAIRVSVLERAAPLGRKLFEPLCVDAPRVDAEEVAGELRDQHAVTQRAAEMRHVALDGFWCRGRRSLSPQSIDEDVGRDDLTSSQHECREERPFAPRRQPDLRT